MSKIIPEIAVSNMDASVEFYHSLGFVTNDGGLVDEHGTQWESLALGDANLWLIRQDVVGNLKPGHALGNGVNLFCSVDDVDDLYSRIMNGSLRPSVTQEIETLWYGLREFKMTDPDGYALTFNMQVEQREEPVERTEEAAAVQDTRELPARNETQPVPIAYAGEPARDVDQVQPSDYGIVEEPIAPGRRDIDQVQPGDTGPLPTLVDDAEVDTGAPAGPGTVTQDEIVPYEPTSRTDTAGS